MLAILTSYYSNCVSTPIWPGDHESGLRTSRSLLVLQMYSYMWKVYVRALASQ
jgi:hypothetical protein